jgi:transcriptional regulator GlxA family with amidase domain
MALDPVLRKVGVVLFPNFELLDVCGPVEMLGFLSDWFQIILLAETNQPVGSRQGPRVLPDLSFGESGDLDLLLVPGGLGTRREVNNQVILKFLIKCAKEAEYVLSVCTGSALLAKAGILDGVRATSNKLAFSWVKEQGPRTHWVTEARWVEDGKFWTSAGVAAGMDMALAFIARLGGEELSRKVAARTEYIWNSDPTQDPFARMAGLTVS